MYSVPALIGLVLALIDFVPALIGLLRTLIDLVPALIDLVPALIDLVPALIDLVPALITPVLTLIDFIPMRRVHAPVHLSLVAIISMPEIACVASLSASPFDFLEISSY
ncbi:hypothetical protein ORD22_10450 [Sporosarcina sp. GW1-11]|uniref:hypothetical protein n=1 Tax=Sporosarcina sp. GW1-11 TaxID=2899126 RepID=UPI00294C64F2|nr:hypothetical protein [Sporosarcina sp. GW1-11]MDV6378634.1 hypothetical protein [Sporosarcina sp. GW1-11]